jgi:hypothetical protein
MLTGCRYFPLTLTPDGGFANASPGKWWAFDIHPDDQSEDGETVRDAFLELSRTGNACEPVPGAVPSGCDIDNTLVTVYRHHQYGSPHRAQYFGLAVVRY